MKTLIQRLASLAPVAKRAPDLDRYIGSTVRVGETGYGRYSGVGLTDAQQILPRATQYVMICARLRASIEASIPMRLYRPAGGKRGAMGKGHPVTKRARNAYLRDPIAGPGHKAASYAEYAGDVEEVTDGPILDLIRRPNEWSRGTDFARLGRLFQLIFGNEYVHYAYDGEAYPTTMVHLTPQHTRVLPDPERFIRGYTYGRDGSIEEMFAPDEVWHLKYEQSPFSPYVGISPLYDVLTEADTYAAAIAAELAMWLNGAEPTGVWTLPPEATETQRAQIDAELNNRHRGPRNRGKFHIAALATFTPIQRSPKEMEYLQGKHDLRKTIRNAYGIPESVTDLNDANLASSTTGNRQFMEQTILPALRQDAEDKTEMLLRAFGVEPGEMWFAYDNPVPQDKVAVQNRNVAYVGAGILNIDEARAEEGYDPLPNGEGAVYRHNGVPLDRVGVIQTPPGFGGEEGGDDDDEDDADAPGGADDQGEEEADGAAETDTKVAKGGGCGADGCACGACVPDGAGPAELRERSRSSELLDAGGSKRGQPKAGDAERRGGRSAVPNEVNRSAAALSLSRDEVRAGRGKAGEAGGDRTNGAPTAGAGGCGCGVCSDAGAGTDAECAGSGVPVELKVSDIVAAAGIATKDDDRLTEESDLKRAIASWLDQIRPGLLAAMAGSDDLVVRSQLRQYLASPEVRQQFMDAVREPTLAMFSRGYDAGVGELGGARPGVMGVFDVRNEAAVRFLDNYRFQLAGEVAATTVDRLAGAVQAGIANGETLPQIQERVSQEWPEATQDRAEMIARTEASRAYNEGKDRAWEQSGVVEGQEILLSADPCELCVAIYEKSRVTPLGTVVFPIGASITAGGRTYRNDYRDQKGPPFHPGCRCGKTAVLRPIEGGE